MTPAQPDHDRHFDRRSALTLALLVGAVAGALFVLRWKAVSDPDVVFLPRDARAEWITYASPPSVVTRPRVELEAVFTRAVDLARVEPGTTLVARFQRHGSVTVNGAPVSFTGANESDWKSPRSADVTPLLRAGRNEIVARVRSSSGPPALWLALGEGLGACRSDGRFEASLAGATALLARVATTPMSAWAIRSDGSGTLAHTVARRAPGAADGLVRSAVALAAFAVLAAAFVAGGGALLAHGAKATARTVDFARRRPFVVSVAAAATLWLPLFVHNRALSVEAGFDASAHAEYVQYILDRGSLPLAYEGWEMYQPPLYYLLAAGVAQLGGYARVEPDAIPAIRGIGLLSGVLQAAFVVASLRLLFPERPRLAIAGFLLAAFLPIQLYLHQYVTNEGFAAMLVSAAVFLALRALARGDESVRTNAILGAILGLALLAKFSALIVLVAVTTVIVARLVARGAHDVAAYARTIGALLGTCLLVSGWHFLRVALLFDDPFIGNWDPASGFGWWQDPGYHVFGDFARFGESLSRPVFAAAHSVPDALYSTLWGDGMVGGRSVMDPWPPWNFDLMAGGYLVALVPTVLLAAGFLVASVRLVRTPRAEWFLLLGVLFLTGFGVLSLALDMPSYAQAKAFYGSAALVPLCAVGVIGFDLLASRSRVLGGLALFVLVFFAVTSYGAYWSEGGAVEVNAPLREDVRALHERSIAAHSRGDAQTALATASRIVELEPGNAAAWLRVASLRYRRGETDAAIAAARESLRVEPVDPTAHALLGAIYRASGDRTRALEHYETANRIRPSDPAVRSALAEIRAEP